MKHHLFFVLAILFSLNCLAECPKREMRATWFTTHYAIDWPRTYVKTTGNTSQIAAQKKEMTDIMDALVAGHMNAFCFQARPTADAFYKSRFEPWSANLSGTRGKDPGYDPLAYAVEEGHKRGLEVHLWVNPYRYEVKANSYGANDPLRKNHPDWLLYYDNGSYSGTIIDPGQPECRQYVIDVLMEMINNYDVDGILMDDYFYPYGGTTYEDSTSVRMFKPEGMNVNDWRRANVDSTMKMLYDTIQAVKPWVRFGMGPFGIWTTQSSVAKKYGITLPSGITGLDDYSVQYCNTVEWVKGGYVDYIAPQLYWPTTSVKQDYDVLCKWWSQEVCKYFSDRLPGNKRVDFFVSQAAYRYDTDEIVKEIDDNRLFNQLGGPGSVFYNTTTYIEDNTSSSYGTNTKKMHLAVAKARFIHPALPPAMDWKEAKGLGAPTGLKLDSTILSWQHAEAERFTVYAYPSTMDINDAIENSVYLQGVAWGKKSMDMSALCGQKGLNFAVCAYDRYGNEYTAAILTGAELPDAPIEPLPDPIETGDYTLQQIWKKDLAASQSLTTGNANRSMTYYHGQLYVSDGANYKLHQFDADNGQWLNTTDLESMYFAWYNVRATSDGRLLLGNSKTNASTFSIFDAGDINLAEPVTPTLLASVNMPNFGRSDYFYPYGTWKNGFLLAKSNLGGKVARIPVNNGVIGEPIVIENNDIPSGISAKAIAVDDSTFYATSFNTYPTRHSLATGAEIESFGSEKPSCKEVSGMAVFMLNGKRFIVTPTDIFGGIEILDITNGLNGAHQRIGPTPAIGENSHSAYTVDICARAENDTAYIYVLAPDNGIAAYRLTEKKQSTSLSEMQVRDNTINVYSISGQLIYKGKEIPALQKGIYIIQEGEKCRKIIY